jgi:hypothetical protein
MENSYYVERNAKLKELAASSCLTLKEMGAIVGVTKERARQILGGRMGWRKQPTFSGRKRRALCSLGKRQKTLRAVNTWLTHALHQQDLSFTFLTTVNVNINGWSCQIKKANICGDRWRFYAKPGRPCDVVLIQIGTDFLVVPTTFTLPKHTMTNFSEADRGRPDGIRWHQYRNAWDILRTPKESS